MKEREDTRMLDPRAVAMRRDFGNARNWGFTRYDIIIMDERA